MKLTTKNMTLTAALIAMGLILPTLMHMLAAGTVLLPMHIPVIIAGLLLGAPYGALCGLILPYLSSLLTGMPPLFPTAIAMSLELCAYGTLTGWLYRNVKWSIYPAMIASMLGGRAISGIANAILMGIAGRAYSLEIFLTAAFVTGFPGIVIQLSCIPALVLALQKTRFFETPARRIGTI
ncbi:ECF transporter S component [Eubacteriales bacterium OttesenSCG-928-K08]|nr:ECF transporter S component [Eubacteriales bacterium OttesenSCG-928-K08]